MGWWSKTLTGGDTPYDLIAGIQSAIRGNPSSLTPDRKKLNAHLSDVLAWCLRHKDNQYEDMHNIAGQVLGVMILKTGADLPPYAKKHILKCARNDRWSKTDAERKALVDAFIAQVEAYVPGTPVEVTEEGLFESFARVMTPNQTEL